jgi:hypothetical protein
MSRASLRELKITPLKRQILEHAVQLRQAQALVRETFDNREAGPAQHKAWEDACYAFHISYGKAMAVYDGDLQADLKEQRPEAIEFALSFLECRPYFFRSGYLWKEILRWVKRLPMRQSQAKRRDTILERYAAYRADRLRRHDET